MMLTRSVCVFLSVYLWSSLAVADTSDPKPLFLEGYAGQVSYKPGEELTSACLDKCPEVRRRNCSAGSNS